MMVLVEDSVNALTVFKVECSELLSNSEDDDSFTLVEDGDNNVNTLLPVTVTKLVPGVTPPEEIKVSVDDRSVTLVNGPGSLTLKKDVATAFAEETEKVDVENERRRDTVGDNEGIRDRLAIVWMMLDLTEVVAVIKLEDDSSKVRVEMNISVVTDKSIDVRSEICSLSVLDLVSNIVLVDVELLFGWIPRVDFGKTIDTLEVKGVADEVAVDRIESESSEILDTTMAADVKGSTDVFAFNDITAVGFGSADVIVSIEADNSCVVVCVAFNDMVVETALLNNNVGDELSTSVLLETVFVDSALVTENVVFDEDLRRDEMLTCTDRLEKLSWAITSVE